MDVGLEELAWRVCGYSSEEADNKMNKEEDIDAEILHRFSHIRRINHKII